MHRSFSQVPLRIKIVMIGDSGVGKTNIKERFCRDVFKVLSSSTVGIQYASRQFWAPWSNKKERFQVNFWDVGGAQNHSMITPLYFKNAIGVVYVFDVTKQQSLESLLKWRQIVQKNSNCPQLTEILIGNKTDLINLRQVSMINANQWAYENSIELVYQTSALTGYGVNDALEMFIGTIIKKMNAKGIKIPLSQDTKVKRHRGCC